MNKLAKISMACAVGFALLLGGAGTLALWNTAPAAFGGSAVQSGVLRVDFASPAVSTYTGTTIPASHIVPGDDVTVSQPVTITATGDNLRVTLNFTVDFGAAGSVLEDTLDHSFTFKAYNAAGAEVPYTNVSAADARLITQVEGSFTFPVTAGNDAQNGSIDLGRASVTVTQVG